MNLPLLVLVIAAVATSIDVEPIAVEPIAVGYFMLAIAI